MVDISLNCLYAQGGEENYEFTIITNTENSVEKFKKDIKEKIKVAGEDIFNDIEADQLTLWQARVDYSNEKESSSFTSDSKNLKKLEGIIGDYWTEQPPKEFIHVVVYVPYLTVLRMLDSLTLLSKTVAFKDYTNISLQQLYNEQYIKQGNILFYNKTYKDVEFTHKCEIKDIYNTEKLLVFFISTETLMSFDSLSELELYILKSDDRFKNITRATGSVYDWFYIIDKDVNKGSIIQLRNQYVKDRSMNPTEKEEKEEARLLGKRKILPVLDPIRCKILDEVKNEFEMEFKKEVPFSYVCEGLVDHKEVIIAFVNQSEGTPVSLPAEFKGFPVLISYEALVLYHRSFHKDLTPGISIGKLDEPLNACTLGALFQNTTEPDKTFILTAKHGVGKEGDEVVQPGTLEQINTSTCAKVTKYNFIGADSVRHYLDYAFCEIVKDRTIPEIPNVPLGRDIKIRRIKTSVGGERGDSGAAVFDDNGLLWGIVIAGIIERVSFVIPINLILDDVKKKFDGLVFTLKEDEQEKSSQNDTNLEIANCSNLLGDLL